MMCFTMRIRKKHFFCTVAAIVVIALCSYGAYNQGTKEGYALGVAETKYLYDNPKGDGATWFVEEINNGQDCRYHSTPKCPNITGGINLNLGFTNAKYRKQHSQFCSKCMDERLMRKCSNWLYTDKDWD